MHSPSQHCTQCKDKNGMVKSIILFSYHMKCSKVQLAANACVSSTQSNTASYTMLLRKQAQMLAR